MTSHNRVQELGVNDNQSMPNLMQELSQTQGYRATVSIKTLPSINL